MGLFKSKQQKIEDQILKARLRLDKLEQSRFTPTKSKSKNLPPRKRKDKPKQQEEVLITSCPPPVPKDKSERKGVFGWFKYSFQQKKTVKAVFFLRSGSTDYAYVTPVENKFKYKGQKFVYDENSSYYEPKNKIYTCYYYEGCPLPVRLYSSNKQLDFQTVSSDIYERVMKMEYIKVLATATELSKYLKNNFFIALITLILHVVLILILVAKLKVINF